VNEQSLGRKLVAWWVLVGALSLLAYSANFTDGDPPDDVLYRYESAAVGLLLYALIFGILLIIASGLPFNEAFGLLRPTSWGAAAGWAFGLLITLLVLSAALEPILGGGEEQGLDPSGWRSDRALAFALNAVVIAGVAPVVEELMYRGLGYTLLASAGVAAAIFANGAAFALAHGLVRAFPVLFIVGAGLAFLRWRTNSVYPPILLHASFNGIGLLAGVAS
jgi:membrane protease YdiL (CAAX protease family)